MTDWQKGYEDRNWNAIDNWWRNSDDQSAKRSLLTQLQRDVPKRTFQNGVETAKEFVRTKDAPEAWKGAAEILELGELEADVAGDPLSDVVIWADQCAKLSAELQALSELPEVTKGDFELSRKEHSTRAIEALKAVQEAIEFRVRLYRPAEQESLREFASSVAINAMRAGFFAHLAESKEIEAHAVRGKISLSSASDGGKARAKTTRLLTERILEKIAALVAKGHTRARAADLVYLQGFGKSKGANLQLMKRHKPK